MKKIALFIFIVSCFMACQKAKVKEEINPDTEKEIKLTADAVVADNELTAEEKDAGWKLLFDGKTLDGWRMYKDKENNSWEVDHGTLHCKAFEPKTAEKRADLITTDQYDDFELSFEWKIQKQSNSGVMFRVREDYEEPYATGPEYQILDDVAYADVHESNFTGCLFGMYAAGKKTLNPVGHWNQSQILSKNNHVEHWLNGEKVLQYDINSPTWNEVKSASKWKTFSDYAKAESGHIDLQDHGNEVWFKNIKIKTN
ncbi:3-keto-disaccharide hydrolase [Pseudochryseolinea flava]|uniref:DUF1080 domain-containing protein n=1 Tax=Pseudochryseolinea flava TaxID=2059302 RepID=A0A364Y1W4_9BACT|nr:DUF1080 domain-containing protein [Pseudochryseolinea flava]RAW00704.1 DUF1080 domain-containing protein [Pseudochryseolinea flava]